MKKHFLILLILLLLFLVPAYGENTMNTSGVPNLPLSVDPTGKTEGFSAILYNNPNGLPTSEANAITETSEGFIWLGSYAGGTTENIDNIHKAQDEESKKNGEKKE